MSAVNNVVTRSEPLEIKSIKTLNPLIGKYLAQNNILDRKKDSLPLEKRVTVPWLKPKDKSILSFQSKIKNGMLEFFYELSDLMSKTSIDLIEVLKHQGFNIYHYINSGVMTYDEKISVFIFSLKSFKSEDFELIWQSKFKMNQKEVALFDFVFTKQEEKDALLLELASYKNLSNENFIYCFKYFRNSYKFDTRADLLKSEIFDAMFLALKKENFNFLLALMDCKISSYNMKLNFLDWLISRGFVDHADNFFDSWKYCQKKNLEDLKEVANFKKDDLSKWLLKKYYEEEDENGRIYLCVKLLELEDSLRYFDQLNPSFDYYLEDNFDIVFDKALQYRGSFFVKNLIKLGYERYLKDNIYRCCDKIIDDSKYFESEKQVLIKQLLYIAHIELRELELKSLLEKVLEKSQVSMFHLLLNEFPNYRDKLLKDVFSSVGELGKIFDLKNLFLSLPTQEFLKYRIFTLQQAAKNNRFDLFHFVNPEYLFSHQYTEKEINSVIWRAISHRKPNFLKVFLEKVKISEENKKFIFFTVCAFWDQDEFEDLKFKKILKSEWCAKLDAFILPQEIKSFFVKNRFAESYSGNVKNSEVVLRWAKDQSSNFILELVEDILEDISEEV